MDIHLIVLVDEALTAIVRDASDPLRPEVGDPITLTPTPAKYEYTANVTLPNGPYYIRIYNDFGVDRRVGYLRVVNGVVNFVGDLDDLGREPTAPESRQANGPKVLQ